jgi:glycosyltransferase involved in cell wall biosynthesis
MKIEIIYGPFSSGSKKFDFTDLYANQSLTGSEGQCFGVAKYLAKNSAHQVSLYTNISERSLKNWENIGLHQLQDLYLGRVPPDVVISFNEPDMMRYSPKQALKICFQQLNDFGYCQSGFENFVDIFISPSESHQEYIKQFTPHSHNKWKVMPNCIDEEIFERAKKELYDYEKIPGSILYCSSPDRGLHLLLQEFPKINKEIPYSSLNIYYDFDKWYGSLKSVDRNSSLIMREFKNRAEYIKYALNKMKDLNINHHKNTSKLDMYKAMLKTEVLAYPTSTPTFTEGFSSSILENMYAECYTVISEQDSLGQIYKDSGVHIVKTPTTKYMSEFTELVVKGLKNKEYRDNCTKQTISFAQDFTFHKQIITLEKMIENYKGKNGQ